MSSAEPCVDVAIAASGDYLWEWNLQTGAMKLSRSWLEATGYPDDGRPANFAAWAQLVHAEDLPGVHAAQARHLRGEAARFTCAYRLRAQDGRWCWCRDRGRVVEWDAAGRPVRMAGTGAEIGELKEAEEALAQQNRLMQLMVDLLPDTIYAKDRQRRKIFANRADRWYMGLAKHDDALGLQDEDVYAPDEAEHFRIQDEAVLAGTAVRNVEERVMVCGEPRWLLTTKVPLADAQGAIVGLVGIGRDITELRDARSALEELNRTLEVRVAERTSSLVEAQRIAKLGSWEYEFGSASAAFSAEARRILDVDGELALSSTDLVALLHPDDRAGALAALDRVRERLDPEPHELRIVRKDGRIVYLAVRAQTLHGGGTATRIVGTVQDITERKRAELEQRRLTAIIEATTDLIGTTDRDGNSIYLNQGGRHLLGIEPDVDISGFNAGAFYPPATFAWMRGAAIPYAIEHGVWTGENVVLHASGREIAVSQVILCHRDHEGKVAYLSTIVRDITLQRHAADALRQSRDELQAANRALEKAARLKDEFLASMSHELRTPLTGILGMTEALQTQAYGALNERQLRSLRLVEESGRHLLELINDILDLSKIEAGQFELHLAPRPLSDICHGSLQMVTGLVQQKQQRLDFSMEPAAIELVADPRRLKQMLTNLLGNAAKFTPEGGELGLRVRGDADAGIVTLTVWDTGVGIAPEDLGKLFQPFTQLDSSLTRKHAGTGLGLSLVRRMAELHGGSVSVTSTPGHGSQFVITLPWSPALSWSGQNRVWNVMSQLP